MVQFIPLQQGFAGVSRQSHTTWPLYTAILNPRISHS